MRERERETGFMGGQVQDREGYMRIFLLGEERTRETWGWAFGQASLDSILRPRTSVPRIPPPRDFPSIMAAAHFLKHGRKVTLPSSSLSRPHTRARSWPSAETTSTTP